MNRIPHAKHVAPPIAAHRDHAVSAVVGASTVVASPARAAIAAHVGGKPKAMAPAAIHPNATGGGSRGYPTKGQSAAAPINASPNTPRPTPTSAVTYGMEYTRRGPDTPGGSCPACHAPAMGNAVLADGMAHANNRLPGEQHHSTTTPQSIIADVKKTLG